MNKYLCFYCCLLLVACDRELIDPRSREPSLSPAQIAVDEVEKPQQELQGLAVPSPPSPQPSTAPENEKSQPPMNPARSSREVLSMLAQGKGPTIEMHWPKSKTEREQVWGELQAKGAQLLLIHYNNDGQLKLPASHNISAAYSPLLRYPGHPFMAPYRQPGEIIAWQVPQSIDEAWLSKLKQAVNTLKRIDLHMYYQHGQLTFDIEADNQRISVNI